MCLTFLNPTVFVYPSLARSHSLSAASTPPASICACVPSGNGPFRAAALSLFTGGSSLPLGDKADRKWEFTLAHFTQKKQALVEELQRSSACSAAALCHHQSHDPPSSAVTPSWLLSQPSIQGGVGWPEIKKRPSVQQQRGLSVCGTGRSLSASRKQSSSCAPDTEGLEGERSQEPSPVAADGWAGAAQHKS